jgi:aryl-alcohol dehydrogenase-like predicted oxidoreductase
MEKRRLGKTELLVSHLGMGLAEIGHSRTLAHEKEVARVLNIALDRDINFLDTAACYGVSEELIGRSVATRRDEFILSTKVGHVTGEYTGAPWTYQTIADSIERSLVRMNTDHVDIVHLHSCNVEVLERGEVIRALEDARHAGKTRFIGYSGDNEAARWAVESGLFDTLQTSFNLVDQQARSRLFPLAIERDMGIIAKRPIANAAWGHQTSPSGYADEYHRRAQIMIKQGPIPGAPDDPILLALGFTLGHEAVSTAIVGTSNPQHMEANIRQVEHELPIEQETIKELEHRFQQLGAHWTQEG